MKPKALVVDDVKTHHTALKTQLIIHGFEVDIANDGLEAWNLLKSNNYKIVFTDFEMPNMNGLELLTSIKKNLATKNTNVIMLSMVSNSDIIDKALRLGAIAYLVKPFSSQKIRELLAVLGLSKS